MALQNSVVFSFQVTMVFFDARLTSSARVRHVVASVSPTRA
jgi:hypothetical protein